MGERVMELQAWRAIAASVIGTSHHKTQSPCQDAHRVEILAMPNPVVVLIASDGAGSASRSEFGSQRASQELLDNVRLYLEGGGTLPEVSRSTASEWLENAAEAVRRQSIEDGIALREYACTLLAAIVCDQHALFLQVGDGAIVFMAAGEDDWCLATWPQHGEYINTTKFLTEPASRAEFEFISTSQPIYEVAVFSDGIESLVLHYPTKTVHRPFFDTMFPVVRALADPGLSSELSEQLTHYLASPAITQRTDDDITLLMASRVKTPPSRALVCIEP
jgi:hypothetical protein